MTSPDPWRLPARTLDLSRWYLTLPVPDPGRDDGWPWDVRRPALDTFCHDTWYRDDAGKVWFIAPVGGASTGPDGASQCQLRETTPTGADASWGLADQEDHVLYGTLDCDPSGIAGRRECIVGQLRGPGPTSPVYVCVNANACPYQLIAFKDGRSVGVLLDEVYHDTVFSYRITVTGRGPQRRVYLAAGYGADPGRPQYAWPVEDFTIDGVADDGCFFKAGVNNREPITGSGRGQSIARFSALTVV